jgi:hypothetical protein
MLIVNIYPKSLSVQRAPSTLHNKGGMDNNTSVYL